MSTLIFNPLVRAPRRWLLGVYLRDVLRSPWFLIFATMAVVTGVLSILAYGVGAVDNRVANIYVPIFGGIAVICLIGALVSPRGKIADRQPDLVASVAELRRYRVKSDYPNDWLWEAVTYARVAEKHRVEHDLYLDDTYRMSRRDRHRMAALVKLISEYDTAAQNALNRSVPFVP